MARKSTKTATSAKPKATKAKAKPEAEKVVPEAASDASTADAKQMKKPDLLDATVARTNLKKRDVKPALEAALALIGDALRDGTELNLPPLGKVRVVKSKELGGGANVLTLKLRTPKHAAVAAQDSSED